MSVDLKTIGREISKLDPEVVNFLRTVAPVSLMTPDETQSTRLKETRLYLAEALQHHVKS